ncbi:RadC family protein [Polycladidibacter hongkongensis]|uniref:RadC family protein n=1 Tax=Polycladidibacter hongkongensis TaxID=1647556 RepID=UPI0009E9DF62|nr:DNA repair protein RadC [Pseudovibrio hongkongensis]
MTKKPPPFTAAKNSRQPDELAPADASLSECAPFNSQVDTPPAAIVDDLPFPFTEIHTPPATPRKSRSKGANKAQSKHYHGHRERLRQRFATGGSDALQDYELLEMLLFNTIRQGDTKPLAKELLATFGSFARVISAPKARLEAVKGCGPATALFLHSLHSAAVAFAKDKIDQDAPLSSWSAVMDYIHVAMAHNSQEELRLLFLDKKNRLIADEIQQRGTVDHTPVYPREVARRALELNACALIMVHNHPSGDPTPSRPDIEMTAKINSILEPMGIILHDHIIIAQTGHASFKALGLL